MITESQIIVTFAVLLKIQLNCFHLDFFTKPCLYFISQSERLVLHAKTGQGAIHEKVHLAAYDIYRNSIDPGPEKG